MTADPRRSVLDHGTRDGRTAGRDGVGGERGAEHRPPRDATRLHRDAVAIWRLLDSLDDDDHVLRSRLVRERMAIRAEAAALWRGHGWRSVTDDR